MDKKLKKEIQEIIETVINWQTQPCNSHETGERFKIVGFERAAEAICEMLYNRKLITEDDL